MEVRVQQMQEKLTQQNISAAVLRLPENVVLFSQYWPRNGFSFVFIPAEGDAWIIAPEGDKQEPYQGTIKNVRIFPWIRIKDGNPYETLSTYLQELAQQYGIKEKAKIAVDNGADSIAPTLCAGEVLLPGPTTMNMLKKAFNTEELIPINAAINEIRAIKTEADIEKLQITNEIGIQGLDHFSKLTEKPRLREIDIAAEVEAYIAKQASGYKGATYGRAWVQISSGTRTADAWFVGMISSSRKIQEGEFVMLEMGVVVDGYWADLTRTTVVGEPNEQQQKMFDVVKRAQAAGIQTVRDGVMVGEVDAAGRKIIEAEGLGEYFIHITGHGLGFAYHEPLPILAPGSDQVLKAGMVHSVEPGVYIPDVGGVRQEANVLVTETGSRILGEAV